MSDNQSEPRQVSRRNNAASSKYSGGYIALSTIERLPCVTLPSLRNVDSGCAELTDRKGVRAISAAFWLTLLVLLAVWLVSAGQVQAQAPAKQPQDWPEFLGPAGNGVSKETGLLESWPKEGPPLVWSYPVGTGYSAPSVLNGRLVVHHRQEDREIVECLDVSNVEQSPPGQPPRSLWKKSYFSDFSDPYGYNNGPRCSPLLTKDYCYTFGAEGKLLCLRMEDGAVVWERDTHQDFTVPQAFFGVGSTPILEGDRLIVLVGGQPNSGVVAFSIKDGKTLWESVGRNTWDGVATGWPSPEKISWTADEMVVSYASPIAATIHGERHVLCLMRHGLVSVDPATGKERFRYFFRSREHESVNAARPLVFGNRILITAAYRTGAALLEVAEDGNSVQEIWRDGRNLSAHWTTPVPDGKVVYGFDGRHENEANLRCLEIDTGKVLWETTGWEQSTDHLRAVSRSTVMNSETNQVEPWPYYGRGSAILADGKLIVLGERGTLALGKATRTGYQEISRFKPVNIEYPSWAAPVLARGHLYLRSEKAVVCYNIRAVKGQ